MNYNLFDITFNWNQIKDKCIRVQGDRFHGVIIITTKSDSIVTSYGYHSYDEGKTYILLGKDRHKF